MKKQIFTLGNSKFEILCDGEDFHGLGKIWIDGILVRSGALPITPFTQSFAGVELDHLRLAGIQENPEELRISLDVTFRPMEVKLMRDHSFDPIYETGDWGKSAVAGTARLDLVFHPASRSFGGYDFCGFSYGYEYSSEDVPLFFLLEKSSWELDGNIEGATVFSQSACSNPVVTFGVDTAWTTEGFLFFLDPASNFNRCMTHNLPRWASHQAFDHQFKDNRTLLGVFEHVDLIRSLIVRDSCKPELKHFDKYIFDEARKFKTTRKAILLNGQPKTLVAQRNLWTWIFDEVHADARREFGLREVPPVPILSHHYWINRTIDTYYKDIVPAAAAVGARAIFTENFKKSDVSEPNRLRYKDGNGNMCASHGYEIAESMGGMQKFKDYIERCHQAGIKNFMWTNTYVSLAATELNPFGNDERNWFCVLEDTRLKYAGAYTSVTSNLNIKNPEVRKYWLDAHMKIARESKLDGYYFDSFYNLFFMPVNYRGGHPSTMWREILEMMKTLQDNGIDFYIESFGPFGQPGHGHPASYNDKNMFICYYVGLGDGSVTVPVPGMGAGNKSCHDPAFIYYTLAHKVPCALPLFIDGKRIDEVYGEEHRRILREYHELLPQMHRRYLQEDGKSVLWHDAKGKQALLWNFAEREAALPGHVTDLTSGKKLPAAKRYKLQARYTYAISGGKLPTAVG